MRDYEAQILENEFLGGRLYRLKLELPEEVLSAVKPGHFAMVKPSPTYDPMGRRAFAVAEVGKNWVLFFYEVYGRGTKLLSRAKVGESLKVFLPLGKKLFSYEGEKHLLIGGGVGLAGLTLLALKLRELGKEVFIAYGGRTKEQLGMEYWLKDKGFDYLLFTEDGSAGRKGLVTEVLKEFGKDWVIHACGPKGMLKALKELCKDRKLYLSLEERMACGWGVCLGCVYRTITGGCATRVR